MVDFTTKMNETKMCSNFVSNIPIYNDGTKKKTGRGGGVITRSADSATVKMT